MTASLLDYGYTDALPPLLPSLPLPTADLFCGGGGTSEGMRQIAEEEGLAITLVAVNHWEIAISTHSVNHPEARHVWADIEGIEPRNVVPGGYLRLLVASPECIYFSSARGGKPVNDQRRASAGYVLKWVRQLTVDDLILENVPEFEGWGPLYPDTPRNRRLKRVDKPIPERKGELFQKFVHALRRRGYRVEWRVLCAADYGDATIRRRFFLRARSGNRPITWPAPSHARADWRPAREIIDWSVRGRSIYGRKKPLVPPTMRRILTGFDKFSGLAPYLVEYHGDRGGTHDSAGRVRGLSDPLPTQDTSNRFGLATPYLVNIVHTSDKTGKIYPVDEPLRTATTKAEFGLVQPYLTVFRNHADAAAIDGPVPTICANGQHVGVSVPYLVNMKGRSTAANVDAPLPTMTAHAQHLGMATPYLTKYYGTGGAVSVDAPLDTVTTNDRFGLSAPMLHPAGAGDIRHLLAALDDPDPLYRPRVVEIGGVTYLVDILYRMLTPRELATAMGFPPHYIFTGTQGDQVRQVGNAVPVNLAKALCRSALLGVSA